MSISKRGLKNKKHRCLDAPKLSISGYSSQAADDAEKMIETFKDFIKQHKDDIQALRFFYQQPYQRRKLTFEMLEELHQELSKPPLLLTTEKLWIADERLNQIDNSNKKKTDTKRQLTDIISLIRFVMGRYGVETFC